MPDNTPPSKDLSNILPSRAISEGEPKTPQDRVPSFRPYMEGTGTSPTLNSGKTAPGVSPYDLAGARAPLPGPTFQTIQEQAKLAQVTLSDISTQLNTPKLKLKQSTKYLLKNKLNSAKTHINSASEKLGAPEVEGTEVPKGANPLQKFLALVTDGQNQLEATQQHLSALAAKGDEMKPADMLLIQIKLSKAQQELEYSSMLLGKAVDDFKMMMNIQL